VVEPGTSSLIFHLTCSHVVVADSTRITNAESALGNKMENTLEYYNSEIFPIL
jgi:hypothetical protein